MYGTLISSVTVGAGGASSIDFTNIPQTPYTDLIIVFSGRSNSSTGGATVYLKPNGATTNGSRRMMVGDGVNVYSYSGADFETGAQNGGNSTANTFGNQMIYVPNYTGSSNKIWASDSVYEQNATGANLTLEATLWSNTAAITSISITTSSANWVQYSTAYLYGLTKGSGGATVS